MSKASQPTHFFQDELLSAAGIEEPKVKDGNLQSLARHLEPHSRQRENQPSPTNRCREGT